MARPVIGIQCNRFVAEGVIEAQMTGKRTIEAVAEVSGCTPLLIPGMPEAVDVADLLEVLDGVVLTGGRANVHPRHYGEELSERHGEMDDGRDGLTLPMVRTCVERGIPIFGLCRGIQEMNVAFGGTLHPEVGELPGKHRHRMPKGCKDPEIIFALREHVRLTPGGLMARMLDAEEIVTNSLHGQAIQRTGDRVVVEGLAADDTIEAISIADAPSFAVGVQWHAEYNAAADPVSRVLFERLGDAARARQKLRHAGRLAGAA
ncbi:MULTISPECIES: gamma-glutamyl-gamma-aminobutyrate hydrolase family protein [Thalassobaculum]|uniref:gamma-glutamyl-gamma-aminobutyrate hydrolase n=1 Tax=Thalassobaculum litoreum DSM 18839 TaxID=1123362 RepID=A0A8G2BLK3_9PROT|nr:MULTISPECIES: gamma-glutamyl-gamma-aminobutyrate hydrolase family protein [Thalassobaculum]SDG34209.1 putative glutamine amidotransferase [Thalassobaculum litoreum DSM 18839]